MTQAAPLTAAKLRKPPIFHFAASAAASCRMWICSSGERGASISARARTRPPGSSGFSSWALAADASRRNKAIPESGTLRMAPTQSREKRSRTIGSPS
ncbi:MAG: hypothetical protein LC689_14135, partial [Myxococcales bacterium]|nr:hypothetical protein [Myxococcales bacterium]